MAPEYVQINSDTKNNMNYDKLEKLKLVDTLILFVGFIFTVTYSTRSAETEVNRFFGWLLCAFLVFAIAVHGNMIMRKFSLLQTISFFLISSTFSLLFISFLGSMGAITSNGNTHLFLVFIMIVSLSYVFLGEELVETWSWLQNPDLFINFLNIEHKIEESSFNKDQNSTEVYAIQIMQVLFYVSLFFVIVIFMLAINYILLHSYPF